MPPLDFNFDSSDEGFYKAPLPDDNPDNGNDDFDPETASVEDLASYYDIPLENIITDDNGEVIRIIDREGNIISDDNVYSGDEENPDPNTNPNTNPDGGQQNNDPNATTPADTEITTNLAILTAQALGLDLDRLIIDDEGGHIMFSDLTPELQVAATQQMIQMLSESVTAPSPYQNEIEENFINSLRSGKTPLDLAKEILENSGEYLSSTLSDFDLFARMQKQAGVELTPEELKEAYEGMPASVRDKQINAYRENLKKIDNTPSVLSAYKQSQEQAVETEYENTNRDFSTAFSAIEKDSVVAGFKVDKSLIDDLRGYVLAPAPGQVSEFIKALQTPEGVINAAFLYKNIDQYKQNVNNLITEKDQKIKLLENQLKIEQNKNKTNSSSSKKADTWISNQQRQNPNEDKDLVVI